MFYYCSMNRQNIDDLITLLTAIENYAKDIHYNCCGESFYGQHLFADKCAEKIKDYVDQLKEVCLLGHKIKPLSSLIYLRRASDKIPFDPSFRFLRDLMNDALNQIEYITNIAKADENLLGTIAQDIQNNVGLINIMLGDIE